MAYYDNSQWYSENHPAGLSAWESSLNPLQLKLKNAVQDQIDSWLNTRSSAPDQSTKDHYSGAITNAKNTLQTVLDLTKQGNIGDEHYDTLLDAVLNNQNKNGSSLQGIKELTAANVQNQKNQQELLDFRNKAATEQFGSPTATLSEALANPKSQLGDLGQFLSQQQSDVFKQNLSPLIQQKLGGQGLIDSGANVELQSKALGDLERNRQNTLMTAGMQAKDNILGLQRSDILGDIGTQNQNLSNLSDIQRAGLTMAFQTQLEQKRADLAYQLSQISGGGSNTLMQVLGGVGMAASIGGAPFTGGASLAGLGPSMGMLGMGIGGKDGAAVSQGGSMLGAFGGAAGGSSFFSGGGKAATGPVSSYTSPPPASKSYFDPYSGYRR